MGKLTCMYACQDVNACKWTRVQLSNRGAHRGAQDNSQRRRELPAICRIIDELGV